MEVSFSPDIIHSGWLGSKHQLTNFVLWVLSDSAKKKEEEKKKESGRLLTIWLGTYASGVLALKTVDMLFIETIIQLGFQWNLSDVERIKRLHLAVKFNKVV